MHALHFQSKFAIALVNFGIASAILLSAFTLAVCAQDVPRYQVDPSWPMELPTTGFEHGR
jgi:hypothetical protein